MAVGVMKIVAVTMVFMTGAYGGDFIKLSQYHRMPPLAQFEDYDLCMENVPDGHISTYCVTRVVIKPDNGSELWHLVEDFSKDWKRHHNHALLDRGLCMAQCKQLYQSLSNTTRQALRVEKFDIGFPYIVDVTVFKDTLDDQKRYGDMIDVCVNYELNRTYQLRGYTEIEVCDRNDEPFEIDTLDLSFLILSSMIVFFIILSTWYDKSINYKKDVVHYKNPLMTKKQTLLVSFSILRNWYRLSSRSEDPLSRDLRFLQAIRFFTMYLVISGHSALLFFILPTQNASKKEMLYHNIGTMMLTGGVQITQTFLAISGFLLTVLVMNYAEKRKSKPGLLFLLKATVYRYVRLTPVYAFVIFLHATWLSKMQDGPRWKVGSETERVFCRRNWWSNLLYINNYVNADQPCVQQGWYLGCDYQLFVLGTLLLIMILKFRKLTKFIIAVAVVLVYLIPAVFIYNQKLDAVFLVTPQAQRFVLWFDQYYQKAYIPLHMNLGNYLAGMITGLIYLHLRKNNIDPVQKRWFRILWFSIVPLAIGSLLVHYIFYVNDFEKPSLWMAIIFPMMKYTWGIFSGLFLIGFVNGVAPTMRRIFHHRVFETLGRLTYSAYLIHVFVMRLFVLSNRSAIHFNHIGSNVVTLASLIFSYMLALMLCLALELPVSALQKLMFGDMKGGTNSDVETEPASNGNIKVENCSTNQSRTSNINISE
ncbi:nose resistant to fluoxetine protein 6-like [Armigeres subalbatus]|uniref:nose resistant to fluoxetine protein 6-like n=1 Tax=Armigeres subalbatus TaxID=124917 RepID=UPI002ED630FA